MKKILSVLLVGVFLGGFFGGMGVGFAAGDCPDGQYFSDATGKCRSLEACTSEQVLRDGVCGPKCGDGEIYKDGACKTTEHGCEDGEVYKDGQCTSLADVVETGGDEAAKILCESEEGYIYDVQTNICYESKVQSGTIIPSTQFSYSDCEALFLYDGYTAVDTDSGGLSLRSVVKYGDAESLVLPPPAGEKPVSPLDVLACAIKTGNVRFWMVPFYIKYLIQFALSIAGLIAVLSVIIGGYFYIFGGISDDKDKGKRAILYGILGFVLAMTSWAIVNVVMSLLTR
ncbi:TrbC/VirB2 family protein [Candidatus Peregrinibacteria bacterium]|jgi:hypothetical protein|nr:TrbC/VirB2 family protein [Candidatus Peregrinibacteria bacterium]MBT4055708.1 TrbC/VirB2 family protein [Candidatus Peregrinibacteria bacterium]